MNKFTFLSKDQMFGENRLEIFDKVGTRAAPTDFAILLGGYVSRYFANDNTSSLANRTGYYWTQSVDNGKVHIVSSVGEINDFRAMNRIISARPITSLTDITSDNLYEDISDEAITVEYGFYPQTAVDINLQKELEKAYKRFRLESTGNTYTVDSRKWYEFDKEFSPKTINEYEYNGERYVRVIANSCFDDDKFELSNMKHYRNHDAVWVKVEPVRWLVDKKTNTMVSERLLFAGVPFRNLRSYSNDFNTMDIKKYMDRDFARDLIQSITIVQLKPMGYSRTLKK